MSVPIFGKLRVVKDMTNDTRTYGVKGNLIVSILLHDGLNVLKGMVPISALMPTQSPIRWLNGGAIRVLTGGTVFD